MLLGLSLLWGGGLPADQTGAEEGAPSIELLEFLGGFETPEGEWFDPLQLAEGSPERSKVEVNDDD